MGQGVIALKSWSFILQVRITNGIIQITLKKFTVIIFIMKKIEAIIRTSKFEQVHAELEKIGISFFTFFEVKGIGTEHAATQQYRGTAYDVGFIPRTRLEIVVPDEKADPVIECILNTANTGKIGDGKIFLSDVLEVYRIRNKDKGNEAL